MSALIGVVGDFNPKNPTHRFTNEALDHVRLPFEWVPTDAIEDEPEERLAAYHAAEAVAKLVPGTDAIWLPPSVEGADAAELAKALEGRGVPLVGT